MFNHKMYVMFFKRTTAFGLGMLCSLAAMAQVADSIKNVEVEEVTVMASRMGNQLKDLPQKVEIIPGNLINSLPSENLAEVLKRATNLDIIQYPGLSATVGMRGFSPSAHSRSYTLILINGKPSGTNNLSAMSMDNVDRIEIVKGPYSVLYGSDAMAGVINIITRQGTDRQDAVVSVESGSFGQQKMAGNFSGTLNDRLSFRLGFSHSEQQKDYRIGKHNLLDMSDLEKLILDKASYGDKMLNSSYELNHLNGFFGYQVDPLWQVSAEGSYTYAFDVSVPGTYWGNYGQTKKDINRLNLLFNLERNSETNRFRFNPYFSKELDPNYSDNTDGGYLNFESNIREYGFQLQDVQAWGNLNVLIGMDYKMYDYESDRWESKGTPTDPYKPNNENLNTALFAQLAYTSGTFSMNAGLRYDHFKYHIDANEGLEAPEADERYSTFNPSVGVQVDFLKNIKAHASFGTAFSVPDAYKVAGKYSVYEYFPEWDYTWSQSYVGNPDLEPEKSRTMDLGLKYASPNNKLKIDMTYFYTIHDNKIVEKLLETGENTYTYVNANKSNMEGLELMSSFNLGSLFPDPIQLELYSNWTWMLRNEFEEETESGKLTRDMLYTRKSNGNFGVIYGPKSFLSMQLNARYIGSRLETDSFSSLRPEITADNYYTGNGYQAEDKVLKHPDYLLFDYSIKYSYNKHVDFGITVSNLLDENYSEKDGYNMPGRGITAKVAYKF
jgi:outer membrane receptor protein involved in Fe transport